MRKLALAVTAAAAVLCARAEAAVYTQTTAINIGGSDIDGSLPFTVFLPNFDSSRGTLNSVTFSLSGSADQQIVLYQGTVPTTSAFADFIRLNNSSPIALGTTTGRLAGPTTIENQFSVAGSETYLASTGIAAGSQLALTIDVGGTPQQPICCGYTFVRLTGQVVTTFDYAAVPEPISASLLLAPILGFAALRRRA